MNNLPTDFHFFKPTQDDWYPAFEAKGEEKLVEIGFYCLTGDKDFNFRVSAWGNDDFGLEKDFKDKTDAVKCLFDIMKLEYVNKEDLEGMKFHAS